MSEPSTLPLIRCGDCLKPVLNSQLYDQLYEQGLRGVAIFNEIERITGKKIRPCCRITLFNPTIINRVNEPLKITTDEAGNKYVEVGAGQLSRMLPVRTFYLTPQTPENKKIRSERTAAQYGESFGTFDLRVNLKSNEVKVYDETLKEQIWAVTLPKRGSLIANIIFIIDYVIKRGIDIVYYGELDELKILAQFFPQTTFYAYRSVGSNNKQGFTNNVKFSVNDLEIDLTLLSVRKSKIALIADVNLATSEKSLEKQEQFVTALKPIVSYLSFRPPYITKDRTEYKYFSGKLYYIPWGKSTSTETKLVVTAPYDKISYDLKNYESTLFYHNYTRRNDETRYRNLFMPSNGGNKVYSPSKDVNLPTITDPLGGENGEGGELARKTYLRFLNETKLELSSGELLNDYDTTYECYVLSEYIRYVDGKIASDARVFSVSDLGSSTLYKTLGLSAYITKMFSQPSNQLGTLRQKSKNVMVARPESSKQIGSYLSRRAGVSGGGERKEGTSTITNPFESAATGTAAAPAVETFANPFETGSMTNISQSNKHPNTTTSGFKIEVINETPVIKNEPIIVNPFASIGTTISNPFAAAPVSTVIPVVTSTITPAATPIVAPINTPFNPFNPVVSIPTTAPITSGTIFNPFAPIKPTPSNLSDVKGMPTSNIVGVPSNAPSSIRNPFAPIITNTSSGTSNAPQTATYNPFATASTYNPFAPKK
ncbi:MAG: hypothetical protein Solumvirus2_7 [Solumvirus sp.]|uniref:Uncharacterized protein n=1 Tax=Solumvirus sp. TaxID=2487773 RepID=A0A3G5AGH2_9VIRU|nr:MAG: hypothetical protein Solumvirus2_7 [Solumvirus sp.]